GHYRSGTKAQRFDNVAAPTNTTIQKHLYLIADACHNLRQNAQSRRDTVELAAAVIGNNQRVCSHVHCATGIVSSVYPFYDNGPVPPPSNPLEILPGHNRVLESSCNIRIKHRPFSGDDYIRKFHQSAIG